MEHNLHSASSSSGIILSQRPRHRLSQSVGGIRLMAGVRTGIPNRILPSQTACGGALSLLRGRQIAQAATAMHPTYQYLSDCFMDDTQGRMYTRPQSGTFRTPWLHSGMNIDACRLLNLVLRPFMMARASTLGRLCSTGLCQAGSSSLLKCHECHCLPLSAAICSASGSAGLGVPELTPEGRAAWLPSHLHSIAGPTKQSRNQLVNHTVQSGRPLRSI